MQAGTLALVFEERVMPRASASASFGAAGSAAGSVASGDGGAGGGGGVVCEEAEAETEGGPEHLVSFEALMTWPDVQVCVCVFCICVCVLS